MKKLTKRYLIAFVLLTFTVLSIGFVSAADVTVAGDANDSCPEPADITDDASFVQEDSGVSDIADQKNYDATTKTAAEEYTHKVTTSEELTKVLDSINSISSPEIHIIELDGRSFDSPVDLRNEYVTLIINGNNNQYNVISNFDFDLEHGVTINDLNIDTTQVISNHNKLYLNNVTITTGLQYKNFTDAMEKRGMEVGTEEFKHYLEEELLSDYYATVYNYNYLEVNNSRFVNVVGDSINNLDEVHVDNTVFDGIIGDSVVSGATVEDIRNSIFINSVNLYSMISSFNNLYFENNTVEKNYVCSNSAIENQGTATVSDSRFIDNSIKYMIDNRNQMIFSNNRLSGNNETLFYNSGNLTVKNCEIFDCNSDEPLIYNGEWFSNIGEYNGDLLFENNTVSNNNRSSIILNFNRAIVKDCTFTDNEGQVLDNTFQMNVTNNVFVGNGEVIGNFGKCLFDENIIENNTSDYIIYTGVNGNSQHDDYEYGFTFTNNRVKGNHADYSVMDNVAPVELYNNTLYDLNYTMFDTESTVEGNLFIEDEDASTITVYVNGLENYLKPDRVNVSISLDSISDVDFSEKVTISGSLMDEQGLPVKFKDIIMVIDENNIALSTNSAGLFEYTYKPEDVKTYNVLVYSPEDEKYSYAQSETSFKVILDGIAIVINPIGDVELGKSIDISGQFVNDNGMPISDTTLDVLIGGTAYGDKEYVNITRAYVKTDENGKYNLTYMPATGGMLNITVYYAGDKIIPYTSQATSAFVIPIGTVVTMEPLTQISAGESILVTGRLTDANSNALRNSAVGVLLRGIPYGEDVYTNISKQYVRTDDEGHYTCTLTPETAGSFDVCVYYPGYHSYRFNRTDAHLNVMPHMTEVSMDELNSIYVGDDLTIAGRLTSEGSPLRYTSVGVLLSGIPYGERDYYNYSKEYVRTDNDGYYTYKVTPELAGTLDVCVYYPGYHSYRFNRTDASIYVEPHITIVTVDDITDVILGENVSITGRLTSEGSPLRYTSVGVLVNGKDKTYTRTDGNGYYNYSYTTKEGGTNTVTVYYPGYHNYYFGYANSIFNAMTQDIGEIQVTDVVQSENTIQVNGKVSFNDPKYERAFIYDTNNRLTSGGFQSYPSGMFFDSNTKLLIVIYDSDLKEGTNSYVLTITNSPYVDYYENDEFIFEERTFTCNDKVNLQVEKTGSKVVLLDYSITH